MGFGLHAYRVDLAALRAFSGSRDEVALAKMKRKLRAQLSELDSAFAEEIADQDEQSAEVALSAICNQAKPKLGAMHGYVVEALCGAFGAKLKNPLWERFSTKFFSDLDDELTDRGLRGADAMVEIVQSGVPLRNVTIREPECGSMKPAQVRKVGKLIDKMDLSELDADQKKGAAEFRKWLAAAERHDQGFAVFNY